MKRAFCMTLLGALGCASVLTACGETADHPIVSNGGSAGFVASGGSSGDESGGSANGGSANGGSSSAGWPNGGTSSAGAASGGTASGGAPAGGSGGTSGAATGGAGATGGSGGAPPVVWKLHRYSLTTNSWETFPLDQIWTGAGAPPPRDISATTNLDVFSTPMLIVFTTSGQYYLRRGSVWSHAAITSKFNRNSSSVQAAYSTPWNATSGSTPPREDLTITSFPNVGIYSVDANLNITSSTVQPLEDATTQDGPPQGSVAPKYYAVVANADDYVNPGIWLYIYEVLENGNLYHTDNSFQWTRYAPASSFPIFQLSGAPNPSTLTAAYYEVAGNVVNFVGP